MNQPIVSIIMSVYKDRGYLKESINSVLRQSFSDFEFLIIDDASPDDALVTIESIQKNDKRIRILKNKSNRGLTKSLNYGFNLASGKYIARIDEGDFWSPEKLTQQVAFLDNHPEYSIVGSQYNTSSSNDSDHNATKLPEKDNEIRSWLIKGLTPFTHPAILFRNEGLNYNREASTSQDFELYLRLFFSGKMANLDEQLVTILIQNESITSLKEEVQFFNHLLMHKQFLKVIKGKIDKGFFIQNGVDFSEDMRFGKFRRRYMRSVLNFISIIGKKTKAGRILKNLLVPDVLIYTIYKYCFSYLIKLKKTNYYTN